MSRSESSTFLKRSRDVRFEMNKRAYPILVGILFNVEIDHFQGFQINLLAKYDTKKKKQSNRKARVYLYDHHKNPGSQFLLEFAGFC